MPGSAITLKAYKRGCSRVVTLTGSESQREKPRSDPWKEGARNSPARYDEEEKGLVSSHMGITEGITL